MPINHRPQAPPSDLLDRARHQLAHRLSLDPASLDWQVGDRMDRKRSTLFHLTLISATSEPVATAYYKRPFFPPDQRDSRHVARAREALANADALGHQFLAMAAGSPLTINVNLASNEASMEVITLGLEGEPMGNPLRFALTRPRRDRALAASHAVGQAVRILEGLPRTDPEPDSGRIWEETVRKLESVAPLMPDADRKRLEKTLSELFEEATQDPNGATIAHGDLSPGNVIMLREVTGLIDFMWVPQLRGFDLSRFVHRLRYTSLSYRPWTTALIEAVLDGYGDRDAVSQPGWRFSELQRLLSTVQRLERRGEGGRRSAGRALDEIKAGL